MKQEKLTENELMVLGLVSEMPRHGYELEQVIEGRGMREWAPIAFSSIYFVLGRLRKKALIESTEGSRKKAGKKSAPRTRRSYRITPAGRKALVRETLQALSTVQPNDSSLLKGMLHWHVLTRRQALGALEMRKQAAAAELERLEDIHLAGQPLPDHVDAMFELSVNLLRTEAAWIESTLDYMSTKHWNT